LPGDEFLLPREAPLLTVDEFLLPRGRFRATGDVRDRWEGKGNDAPDEVGRGGVAIHLSIQVRIVMSTSKKKTPKPSAPPTGTVPASPATPASPDPNAALEALVTQAVSEIGSIEASIGDNPTITAAQKRRATKMRKGGEPIAASIAALAQQHQIESPSLQVAPMTAALGKAAALQPLVTSIAAFAQRLDNIVFAAQSGAWLIALQLYAVLRRQAATDGALHAALTPVTEFMSYRRQTPTPPGQPTKRTQRAIKKSVDKVKKLAPQLLAEPQPAPAANATPAAPPAAGSNGSTQHS
jgi:hypothetical protein